MRFATILALAGAVSAKTITEYVTATASVDCPESSSAVWTQGVTTITVIVPPGNATATWGANSSTWATGSGPSPTGESGPPEVTGGAAAMKASVAGLLGFAGAALFVL